MDSIAEWGYHEQPFNLTCSHCLKDSICLDWATVNGLLLSDIIPMFKFKSKAVNGGTAVMCSSWCLWRHGKSNGIHWLLNKIGHKSNAFKQ